MSDKTTKPKAEKKEQKPKKAVEAKKQKHEEPKAAKPVESKHVKAVAVEPNAAKAAAAKAEEVKVSVSDTKVSEVKVKEEDAEEKSAGGFRAQKKAPEKVEKKEEKKEKKVLEERIYTIPLDSVISSTRKKRANKAVRVVRAYLSRHMHSDNVKIDGALNEKLWSRGIQKPPRSVKVKALKYEDSVVAEISG